jgi:hypothetical protein
MYDKRLFKRSLKMKSIFDVTDSYTVHKHDVTDAEPYTVISFTTFDAPKKAIPAYRTVKYDVESGIKYVKYKVDEILMIPDFNEYETILLK